MVTFTFDGIFSRVPVINWAALQAAGTRAGVAQFGAGWLAPAKVKLVLDDRADLVEKAGFDGVHVDAGDHSPAEARHMLGSDHIVGTFGGSEALLPGILKAPADYLSIGPVFPTTTKQTTKPPIGAAGVRELRAQAGPGPVLVAVGGITLATASDVLLAGANTVAVSAAIFRAANPASEFRLWMAVLGPVRSGSAV